MQSRHAIYPLIALGTDTYLEDDAAHSSPPRIVQPLYAPSPPLCTQERRIPVIAPTEVVFVLFDVTVFRKVGVAVQVTEFNVLVNDERLLGRQWWWFVLG